MFCDVQGCSTHNQGQIFILSPNNIICARRTLPLFWHQGSQVGALHSSCAQRHTCTHCSFMENLLGDPAAPRGTFHFSWHNSRSDRSNRRTPLLWWSNCTRDRGGGVSLSPLFLHPREPLRTTTPYHAGLHFRAGQEGGPCSAHLVVVLLSLQQHLRPPTKW